MLTKKELRFLTKEKKNEEERGGRGGFIGSQKGGR